MSKTIIDALVVTLGLDSANFKKGSDDATKSLDKTAKKGDETAKKLKKSGEEGSAFFKGLSNEALKFFAILTAGKGLEKLFQDTVMTNAALALLSKNIAVSTETIQALGNITEQYGGTAEGLQGTLSMLSRSQTEMSVTGQTAILPYLRALGVALGPPDQMLQGLHDKFVGMDRVTANNFGKMMGIDQGTMNMLLLTNKEYDAAIKKQKELYRVTKEDGEQAIKFKTALVGLKQGFTALANELMSRAAPYLEKALDIFNRFSAWSREHSDFVIHFLVIFATALGGIAAAMWAAESPFLLIIGLIALLAAGIALLVEDYDVWKAGGKSLIDWGVWGIGINAAIKGVTMLRDALMGAFHWAEELSNKYLSGTKLGDKLGEIAARIAAIFGNKEAKAALDRMDADKVVQPTKRGGAAPGADPAAVLQGMGWTSAQAAGIVANLNRESKMNPDAVGDHGQAYGLGQWHPDRQAAFKKWAGKSIVGSSVQDQLGFVNYELRQGSEQRAGGLLAGAKDARTAGEIVSRNYERPAAADSEAMLRGNDAARLAGNTQLAAAGGSTSNNVSIDTIQINMPTGSNADDIARNVGGALKSRSLVFQSDPGMS